MDFAAERRHAQYAWRDVAALGADIVHCNLPDALLPEALDEHVTLATIHHERIERLVPLYRRKGVACVALSRAHARSFPEIGPPPFVHLGLDVDDYPAGDGSGGYIAFLGRIGPEKAPHIAIEAAMRANAALRIAGPHWRGNAHYDAYYADIFMPALKRSQGFARWIGECDMAAKLDLLRSATALLMPLGWDEPFGLVVVEAMLVGTPVIAFRRGSMPELIETGLTGYLVEDAEAMARAIPEAARLDRSRVRERARERFSAERMTAQYETLYRTIVDRGVLARSAMGAV